MRPKTSRSWLGAACALAVALGAGVGAQSPSSFKAAEPRAPLCARLRSHQRQSGGYRALQRHAGCAVSSPRSATVRRTSPISRFRTRTSSTSRTRICSPRPPGSLTRRSAMSAQTPEQTSGDSLDTALLRATDELHRDDRVSDETWAALSAKFDARQLLDVMISVGGYRARLWRSAARVCSSTTAWRSSASSRVALTRGRLIRRDSGDLHGVQRGYDS
jgi:hypothetical protein